MLITIKFISSPLSLLTSHPLFYSLSNSSLKLANLPWVTNPGKTKGQLLVRAINSRIWITWEHVRWEGIFISSILTISFSYGNTGVDEGLRHLLVSFFQSSMFCWRREQENSKASSFSSSILHQKGWKKRMRRQGSPGPLPLWKCSPVVGEEKKKEGMRMWAWRSLLLLTYRKRKTVKKAFPIYYLMRYVIFKYVQLRWKIHVVLLQNSLNCGWI